MRASLLPERRFNEKKATQAASSFLKLAGGQMNYMLLIKLLYLLDRRALKKWGRPVTGDDYFSMKLGPVLSEVLNLITTDMPDPATASYWARHISEPSHYVVKLRSDPGDDELSEAEEGVIELLYGQYGNSDPFQLSKRLHRILPEWTQIEYGRSPITYRDILKAVGKTPKEIAAIEEDLSSLSKVRHMFAPRQR